MSSINKSLFNNDMIRMMYRRAAGNSFHNNNNIIQLIPHPSTQHQRCASSLSTFIFSHNCSSTFANNNNISRKRCPNTSYHHSQILAHNIHNSSTLLQKTDDNMKDEYGDMDSSGYTYIYKDNNGNTAYQLENNEILPLIEIRYQTYGVLNETTRNNVIVICHALTGNASIHTWWNDLLGPGKPFDTDKYYIVCCNILGSCYGSTNPNSINPNTEKPYGIHFPNISIKDTVRLQLHLLQKELNIHSVAAVIGGSFGGMQVLEYSILGGSNSEFREFHDLTDTTEPYIKSGIPIACGSYHTAWQIGISEVQRQMIYHDVEWKKGNYHLALSGLQLARQLGMISYRTAAAFENKFSRNYQYEQHHEYQLSQSQYKQPTHEVQQISDSNVSKSTNNIDYGSNILWNVKSYLIYQGQKFLSRFDPITYVKLTEQLDSHNIARGRSCIVTSTCCNSNDPKSSETFHNNIQYVLNTIEIPTCVIGIDSDILYPLSEQQYLHDHILNSEYHIIHSNDGHDGFLLEQKQVGDTIKTFLLKQQQENEKENEKKDKQ